jgi:hypothetical protein
MLQPLRADAGVYFYIPYKHFEMKLLLYANDGGTPTKTNIPGPAEGYALPYPCERVLRVEER